MNKTKQRIKKLQKKIDKGNQLAKEIMNEIIVSKKDLVLKSNKYKKIEKLQKLERIEALERHYGLAILSYKQGQKSKLAEVGEVIDEINGIGLDEAIINNIKNQQMNNWEGLIRFWIKDFKTKLGLVGK